MKDTHIYMLYIGTTKVVAMRGLIQENGTLTVERFVKVPADGFENGAVVNIEKASVKILEAVKGLGSDFDYTKVDFYVVLSNPHIHNFTCSSSLYFGEIIKSITRQDILRVIAQTKSVSTLPLDEHIIEEIPKEFIVNDLGGIIDPIELEARRLGVRLLIFTVNMAVIRNLTKALERVDIVADKFMPRALPSCYAILREEEKRDGVLVIDIGGYVTDIVYIRNTIVHYYETVSAGAEYISSFLADNVNVPHIEAKRLKERFGSVLLLSSFDDEIIPVVDIFGKTKLSLNKKRLYDKIYVSAKDLMQKIKPVVDTIHTTYGLVPGIVLTGGGAALDGILDMAQEVFGLPVRLGVTRKIHGPKEVITSPQYTSVVGVMGYVYDKIRKEEHRFTNKSLLTKKIIQAKEWIQDNF